VLASGLAPAHVGWSANGEHWRWGEGWELRAASRRQGPALEIQATRAGARPAPDSWWNQNLVRFALMQKEML